MTTEGSRNDNKNDDEKKMPDVEDAWMIRPCDDYDDEYGECTAIKARFHQYFIHGQSVDCNQWKRDSDNCYRWVDKQDVNAAKELINSEKERRMVRLRGHYQNTTWTKRKSPPEDWNKPLPEYLQKEYENSFLQVKSKEMQGQKLSDTDTSILDRSSYCILM